ncbi:MAG: DUF1801 domain-containing protein [Thermoflexaceae bacterium]|nr:DUF1801 domain-containing protein [Thermoflexaceae bacterium]
MARPAFESVDEYIATFPEPVREILREVRAVIRAAVPDAAEVISYGVPAYRLHGGFVIYFSGFTAHYTLSFPPPFTVFEAFAGQLARYPVSKSAVRLPLNEPVPAELVRELALFRAAELERRAAAKASPS